MNRKRTPQETETAVLTKCARRCALCYGLSHDLSEKLGQVAHVDQDSSNYSEDNLAFLCMEHHSLYDSKTSQHKNYTAHEVKAMRSALHDAISRNEHTASSVVKPPPVDEAHEARKTELAPLIVMEKRFLDFRFVWPHPAGLNGGPVFLARKHWQDKDPSQPLFAIQNFARAPVLEVTVVFDLDDNNTDLSVPAEWQAYGLSNWQFSPMAGKEGIPSLMYRRPRGDGCGPSALPAPVHRASKSFTRFAARNRIPRADCQPAVSPWSPALDIAQSKG